MDGNIEDRVISFTLVVTIKHTVTNKRQTVHIDRLVPSADQQSFPPVSQTVTQPPQSASDPIDNTIEPLSPVPCPSTQSFDDSELIQSQSQCPTRDRRIPKALEPYINARPGHARAVIFYYFISCASFSQIFVYHFRRLDIDNENRSRITVA